MNPFRSLHRRPVRSYIALAIAACCVCLGAAPAGAAAATRYASPAGNGAAPCLETAPCSLEDALSTSKGLAAGDTVLLGPGTYDPAGELTVPVADVTIEGEQGKAPPLVDLVALEHSFVDTHRVTLRDVHFHAPANSTWAVEATGDGSLVERVEVTGSPIIASCVFGGGSTIRDTLCVDNQTDEGAGLAISAHEHQSLSTTVLYGVTAIGYYGVLAEAGAESDSQVETYNSILRSHSTTGLAYDLYAEEAGPSGASVEFRLFFSNFENTGSSGGRARFTGELNQTAAPVFVDAAAGDYREAESSPTRLKGHLAVVDAGELDLAGNPRTSTCAGVTGVDLGAYQFECPPTQEAPPGSSSTGTTGTSGSGGGTQLTSQGPGQAQTKPKLTGLTLAPRRFLAAGTASKGTAAGTMVSFDLGAAATVKMQVLGRKIVKGKEQTVILGSLPAAHGRAGANTVRFSGRLRGRPLAPGKYRLRAIATAGGASSTPLSKAFEVLAAT